MNYSSHEDFEHIAELLDSILNGSTEYAIIATDLDDKIILWNKGAEQLFGYTSGEMLGKQTPMDLHAKNLINKDPLYHSENVFRPNILDYKINAQRKDKSTVSLSFTVTPRLDLQGGTIGYLIIAKDISKAREQERFRDVLLEIAHVINSSKDTKEMCSQIVNVTSSFLDIPVIFICLFDSSIERLTVDSHVGLCDDCTSHSCVYYQDDSFVPEELTDCYFSYSQLTINSGSLTDHAIYEYIGRDVIIDIKDASIIHIPIISDTILIGLLHIVVPKARRDFILTETQVLSLIANEISAGIQRKRLEEEIKQYANNLEVMVTERTDQLREKDAQLIQSGKLATLGEMATGIAHEINQPLGGINLMAQGLLMAKERGVLSNALLNEKLNSIVEQIERVNRIINHLRTFARQSDNIKSEVDINTPLRDVFKLIGQQLVNRNIQVEFDLSDTLPPVLAEQNKLEQVFLNIVGNARDALDEFEIRLNQLKNCGMKPNFYDSWNKKIIIKSYLKNDNVVVDIIDNAGGIPQSIIQRVFEPFFTTKEIGKGTGLGLSISYGIVKEFNGTIEVESVDNKGSTFSVILPEFNKHQPKK